MKLWLVALVLVCAVVLAGAGPRGHRDGGRRGPIRTMFGQLLWSMQAHNSDPLVQRLRGFVDEAGRDPAETKDEMLDILGDLKDELGERRSDLTPATMEHETGEAPEKRKFSSEQSGEVSKEDELRTVTKLLKKVDRAILLVEGLDPQLVAKLVASIKPSIEKLLQESEKVEEEQVEDVDDTEEKQEENVNNADDEQRENMNKDEKEQEENIDTVDGEQGENVDTADGEQGENVDNVGAGKEDVEEEGA